LVIDYLRGGTQSMEKTGERRSAAQNEVCGKYLIFQSMGRKWVLLKRKYRDLEREGGGGGGVSRKENQADG